jgi:hypothetical protein
MGRDALPRVLADPQVGPAKGLLNVRWFGCGIDAP